MIASATDFVSGFKRKIAKVAIENFGPTFIEEGSAIVKEHIEKKAASSFKEIMTHLSPINILNKLSSSNKKLKSTFTGLLDDAKKHLDEQYEESKIPLKRNAFNLASRLIAQGKKLAKEFSSITEESINEFKRDLELAKPALEEQISEYFVKFFIEPILRCIAEMLLSFIPKDQPQQESTKQLEAKMDASETYQRPFAIDQGEAEEEETDSEHSFTM